MSVQVTQDLRSLQADLSLAATRSSFATQMEMWTRIGSASYYHLHFLTLCAHQPRRTLWQHHTSVFSTCIIYHLQSTARCYDGVLLTYRHGSQLPSPRLVCCEFIYECFRTWLPPKKALQYIHLRAACTLLQHFIPPPSTCRGTHRISRKL